ncbi:hypothetical protein Trydic_g19882, partial [Trypoxylus dichotomus]
GCRATTPAPVNSFGPSHKDKASDRGGKGPIPPRANVMAFQGAIDDDPATSECLSPHWEGHFLALRIQDEIQHVSEYHKNWSLTFTCTGCHKQYKSKHAAECHLPKCTGQKPQEDDEFGCNRCNAAFATKRGLSQHQRLKHPLARNEARAAETATTSRATRRGKFLFSPEDLELLFQLN